MMRTNVTLLGLALTLLCASGAARAADGADLLSQIDERRRLGEDVKLLVYVEEKQKDKLVAQEMVVYRRDAEEQFVMMVTRPRPEHGKGYLRVERNLWSYDPRIGRWERRTERDRLSGTNMRRSDLDTTHFARDYQIEKVTPEVVGKTRTRKLSLKARPGAEVPFPVLVLWVDDEDAVLKTEEYALSGRLLRTTYVVSYEKVESKSQGRTVILPREIRILDAVEKDRATTLVFKGFSMETLQPNLFTKAWLEGRSR